MACSTFSAFTLHYPGPRGSDNHPFLSQPFYSLLFLSRLVACICGRYHLFIKQEMRQNSLKSPALLWWVKTTAAKASRKRKIILAKVYKFPSPDSCFSVWIVIIFLNTQASEILNLEKLPRFAGFLVSLTTIHINSKDLLWGEYQYNQNVWIT